MAKRKAKSSRPSHPGKETKAGFLSTAVELPDVQDYVVVELRYESPVAYSASKFSAPAPAAKQADSLNGVLEKYDIKALRSHFGVSASDVRSRVEVAASLPPEPEPKKFARKGVNTTFIHSGFVQVVPKKSSDAKKLANALNRKKVVWQAFVAPRPVPAGASGSAAGSARSAAYISGTSSS